MKNNNKIFQKFIFCFAIIIIIANKSLANEVVINAETVDIKEKGNLITATGQVNILEGNNVTINGDKAEYEKLNEIVKIEGNVVFLNNEKNFKILSDKVIFDRKKSLISTFGNTSINLLDQNNLNIEYIINSENSYFDQKNKFLEINKAVIFKDLTNNYEIKSQKITYDLKKEIIKSVDDTIINYNNNINIYTKDISFIKKDSVFDSKRKTTVKDNNDNTFTFSRFNFDVKKNIFKASNIKLEDVDNNILELKNGYLDYNSKELVGSDFVFKLNKNIFGNPDNDPRLVGNYIITNLSEIEMKKSSFTTCKSSPGKCPSWSISADEVKHSKEKKIIEYKKAWLKIYDFPVAYFPYFFHPDPTVKRQSGFLFPQFINNSNLGFSTQIPYYSAIDLDKDITISPRIYTNNNLLVQTEYRQEFEKSNLMTDFSLNRKDKTNSHFFTKLTGDFDDSFYELKIESVSNDDYLRQYQIQSPIINNYSTLNSSLIYEKTGSDYNFYSSINVIEDLSKPKNDRYEYIFPNFEYSKESFLKESFFDTLNFKSSGNYHKYNTNIDEVDFINDLVFTSHSQVNKSNYENNLNLLIRNINTYGNLSETYKEDIDNKVQSVILFNSKYPLIKENDIGRNYLTPLFSFRYSPNKTINQRNESALLNFYDLFELDRINNKTVEEDASVTLGLEFKNEDLSNNEKSIFGIGINLRTKENKDLPTSSSINEKTSDLIGYSGANITENLSFDYNFIIDQNLGETNYSLASLNYNNNIFKTKFEYMEKSAHVGDESYLINSTELQLNKLNSLAFETNKNLDKNLTDYYNLIYKYKNDCLEASLTYNKQFYKDEDIDPAKNIYFKISFVPFGDINTLNLNE